MRLQTVFRTTFVLTRSVMPLRLIEVSLPEEEADHVGELVAELPILEQHTMHLHDERAMVRVLLDANHAEQLSDALSRYFGRRDVYRIISLPVEATVPVVPRDDAQAQEEEPDIPLRKTNRISREELYNDVASGAKLTWVYVATVALSTIVAAVGLLRGDVAIVIGAMVIAPLLGPNVALSLAATLGDFDLAGRSLKTSAAGVAVALGLSVALGFALTVDPQSPELLSRAKIDLADLALALAAGAAGSLAFTTGVPTVVVGVMVAVALLPPLVVTGLYLGAGYPAFGLQAFLLVLANIACINLAAVATFVAQKVQPRTWLESEKARKATRVAVMVWVLTLATLVALIVVNRGV